MKRRTQVTTVERLTPGDRINLLGNEHAVVRITGTPGRTPVRGRRKLRLYLDGLPSFLLVHPEAPVRRAYVRAGGR